MLQPMDEHANTDICLKKSNVYVEGDDLFLKDAHGNLIARHPLKRITQIYIQRTIDTISLFVMAVGAACAYFGYQYVEHEIYRAVAMGVGGLLIILGLCAMRTHTILVTLADTKFRLLIREDFDTCNAFVSDLQSRIGGQNSR